MSMPFSPVDVDELDRSIAEGTDIVILFDQTATAHRLACTSAVYAIIKLLMLRRSFVIQHDAKSYQITITQKEEGV